MIEAVRSNCLNFHLSEQKLLQCLEKQLWFIEIVTKTCNTILKHLRIVRPFTGNNWYTRRKGINYCARHALCGGIEGVKVFPALFDGTPASYVLPCAALGFYPMCYLSRQTRTAMLDAINQEYIKTARAKGLKNSKIIFKHALRNALIPVITYLGPQIAFTLCGGLVVETVFSIPGLGRYFVQAIQNRDYPLIMGTTIFLAAFIIIMNLVVDLCYKLVDPRIDLVKGGN